MLRRFLFIGLICLFSPSVQAAQKLQGWCEDGGLTVSVAGITSSTATKIQRSYVTAAGTGCTVTVYAAGTTTLSTIYSDNANTPKANPFTAASTGQWFFYAANGRYDVKFSGGGIATPFTLGDFELFDYQATISALTVTTISTSSLTVDSIVGATTYNPSGTMAATATTGGSLGAGNYYAYVIGVSANGGEGPITQDENASSEVGPIVVGGGNNAISFSFRTDPSKYTSYRTYYGTSTGGENTYVSCTTSPCTILRPTMPHTTMNTPTLNVASSSLPAMCYYFKAVPVRGSGATIERGIIADNFLSSLCLTAAQDGARTMTVTWAAVAGAVSYDLYVSSDTGGGPRQFQQYVNVGNTTSGTLTGIDPGTGRFIVGSTVATFSPLWGNADYASAGEIVIPTARFTGRYRTSFGGDIHQGCDLNVECQVIHEMYNTKGTAGSTTLYAGDSYRNLGTEYWRAGIFGVNGFDVFEIAHGTDTNTFELDATSKSKITTTLNNIILGSTRASPNVFLGDINGVAATIYASSAATSSGDTITIVMGGNPGSTAMKFGGGGAGGISTTVMVGTGGAVSHLSSNTLFNVNGTYGAATVISEISNYANASSGTGATLSFTGKSTNGTPKELGALVVTECASSGCGAATVDAKMVVRMNDATVATFYNGLVMAGASGCSTVNDCGSGTINVTNIYKNGTAYNNPDAGLEHWAKGKVELFDTPDRPWAKTYRFMSLAEVEAFAKTNYYLPQLDYFKAREAPSGIFDRVDANLLMHEEEFRHLRELEKRIEKLETQK